MNLISQIIASIHSHCQNKNILAAVQCAVRLARLKLDIPALIYFLLELSGPGSVRRDIETEFPELTKEQAGKIASTALDRYFQARKLRPEEATSLGVAKDSILAYNSNQIDGQINDLKSSLNEAKMMSSSMISGRGDQSFWIEQMIALQHKISAIERSKSNILNACFNYSSQVERTEYASESFMRELTNLTEGISAFLREHCPNAQSQFESILTDMSENAAERRSHLLTSTRRLVNSLADGLSPPQNVPGLERDKPINRLQFFLEKAIEASNVDMDKKNLESMLRLVYDRANKGVHANASKFEVQQSVLQILIYLNALKTVAPFSQKG